MLKSPSHSLCALVALNVLSLAASEPSSAPTVTVFYQGMNSSQVQAARLVGKEGFVYPYTGEKVSDPRALDCIINLQVYPELAEIELFNPQISSRFWYLFRPYAVIWLLGWYFTHWKNGTRIEPIQHDTQQKNATASLGAHIVDLKKVNIGQTGDIAEHKKRVDLCRQVHPRSDIVLYGVSRGSITTFSAYAQEQYEGVRAVVLEGCPSAIPDVVNARYGSWYNLWIPSLYNRFITRICAHDPKGLSALKCVEQFPKKTPVLFITSEKDKTVPAVCTKNLAQKLTEAGHNDVYCKMLTNSSHCGYCFDDKNDANDYQNIVHAFYKKYDIVGYNEQYAQAGAELLERSKVHASVIKSLQ